MDTTSGFRILKTQCARSAHRVKAKRYVALRRIQLTRMLSTCPAITEPQWRSLSREHFTPFLSSLNRRENFSPSSIEYETNLYSLRRRELLSGAYSTVSVIIARALFTIAILGRQRRYRAARRPDRRRGASTQRRPCLWNNVPAVLLEIKKENLYRRVTRRM